MATMCTAKSSYQPVINEKNQLIKKGRCFSCKEVGHQTIDCLLNIQKSMNKQRSKSKLAVNCMTMHKSEQKRPCATELFVVKLDAKENPLLVSLSTLPSDFFAEKALLALCTLKNNSKIKTTALLDTVAIRYSFINPVIARCVCNKLEIEPIRLSKPKAIQDFDEKQAPSVTHVIYPTMSVQDHREKTTPMLITKLSQH